MPRKRIITDSHPMTEVVQSLLSKRITKEMLIQKSRLQQVLKNYEIIPANYDIESPDNKRAYVDTEEGPLPDKLILHGDFILRLKDYTEKVDEDGE